MLLSRPQRPVHNPHSRYTILDHTHTLSSTLVHMVAHISHCLPQHLRLTPGKHTILSPTPCCTSRVRQLRRFRPERAPLSSNSCGSPCHTPAHVWVSHSDPYPLQEPHPLYTTFSPVFFWSSGGYAGVDLTQKKIGPRAPLFLRVPPGISSTKSPQCRSLSFILLSFHKLKTVQSNSRTHRP